MQIEEIDRHHPSTVVARGTSHNTTDEYIIQGASIDEGPTGLGLDISSLDITGSEKRSTSPLADVPAPQESGLERRFSAGNRAFEAQALAVCLFVTPSSPTHQVP